MSLADAGDALAPKTGDREALPRRGPMSRPTWMRALVLASTLGGCTLIGLCIRFEGLFSEATAAWVQALGSVAAIGAGFAVVRHQTDLAAKGEAQSARERLDAARNTALVIGAMAKARFEAGLASIDAGQFRTPADVRILSRSFANERRVAEDFSATLLVDFQSIRLFMAFPALLAIGQDELDRFSSEAFAAEADVEALRGALGKRFREAGAILSARVEDLERHLVDIRQAS